MFTSHLPASVWDPSQSDDFSPGNLPMFVTHTVFLHGGGSGGGGGGGEIKFELRF